MFWGLLQWSVVLVFQRLEREYNCKVVLGKPKVAFRETLAEECQWVSRTHKPKYEVLLQEAALNIFKQFVLFLLVPILLPLIRIVS